MAKTAKKAKKRANTPATPNIGSVGAVKFFREVRAELTKVIWPTRDETIKLTMLVITISVIVGLFIGGLDIALINVTGFIF